MLLPSLKTIKKLFAISRNKCAFPGCDVPLVEPSGTVTGEICHIKAHKPGGPRFDDAQTDEERQGYKNLILLCPRHHTVIDAEPRTFTVDQLLELKQKHELSGTAEINPRHGEHAKKFLERYESLVVNNRNGQVAVNSPGAIQVNTLRVENTHKKFEVLPPEEAIASDLKMKTYIKYLIVRYNEFQKADKSKEDKYKYIAIYNAIQRNFDCKWDYMPKDRFWDLVDFLHRKIDNTKIGRIAKARGQGTYHSFEEHLRERKK